MAHHCHATNCEVPVKPEYLMCRGHWAMVPSNLQRRVWRTYRRGQCDDRNPSREYLFAARDAVRFVAEAEGLAPDLRLYDVMLGGNPDALLLSLAGWERG